MYGTSRCTEQSWSVHETAEVRPRPPPRRLQREVDRCKQAVIQLALLRSHITFTCFDRGRKAFLLRLLKARVLRLSQSVPAPGLLRTGLA